MKRGKGAPKTEPDLMKRFIVQILFLLALFLAAWAFPNAAEAQVNALGEFAPGQSEKILKQLGLSLPIDTDGWHTFLNTEEGLLCRFLIQKSGGNFVIAAIQLTSAQAYPYSIMQEDHHCLTGYSLKALKSDRGISLGDPASLLLNRYGKPQKTIKRAEEEYWIYEGGKFPAQSIFFLSKNRIISIFIGK